MIDYMPKPLKNTWKNYFFSFQFQSLHSRLVNEHERTVLKMCSRRPSDLIERLGSREFWDDLRLASDYSEQVESLYSWWKEMEPLCHLNTKKLLILLNDEITPLEQAYHHIIAELEGNKKGEDKSWRPKWYKDAQSESVKQVKENIKGLRQLKALINHALLLRAQAHESVDLPRNVDDVVVALCHKINKLNLLTPSLEIPEPTSATINDDRRLEIFDILKAAGMKEKDLHKKVLNVVPKRGHKAIRTEENIRKSVKEVGRFCQNIIARLEFKNFSDYLFAFFLDKKKNAQSNIFKKIVGWFDQKGIIAALNFLWSIRYAFLLILSLAAYHYFMFLMLPKVLLIFGTAVAETISSIAFYAVGLAPVWYFGWNMVSGVWSGVSDYMTHWKKQEILEALLIVGNTETFASNQLSQVVVDIPHFDIKHLHKRIDYHKEQLNKANELLKRYSWTRIEKFFCKGKIEKIISEVREKLHEQSKNIDMHAKVLSNHIAKRVGDDISLLDASLSGKELVPILPQDQIVKLKEFVSTFGDKKATDLFDKNSNVLTKLFHQIEINHFSHPTEDSVIFKQPWGGHDIRHDRLKGWKIILNSFVDPAQKEACMQLHDLLAGKRTITKQQLSQVVHELAKDNKSVDTMRFIQGYLFNTLSVRDPQVACLLSQEHKNMITQWYKAHEDKILKAEKIFLNIFKRKENIDVRLKEVNDERLVKYYELLDGADIYAHLSNQKESNSERKNLARKFFEEYDGQSSRAIRLTRLIPDADKNHVIVELAKKHLSWLLNHLNNEKSAKSPFDSLDVELFHNPRLLEDEEKFEFSSFIRRSSQFDQPWSQNMENFLRACKQHGFDSGETLDCYMDKNRRVKTFMLHQKDLPKPDEIKPKAVKSAVKRNQHHV